MSDFEKFEEQLPSKEKFYSSLAGTKIIGKEYKHVLKNKFEMKTMKDYLDLYLKCDFLLLADVFEKLRNNILNNYRLYPSHYLSAPALSWDALLNMTKVELEFFTDPDMLKKDTRAGVSDICNRYIKANKYWKSYVPKHESKHIILLDANNLYGYAMSKFLQKIEFE